MKPTSNFEIFIALRYFFSAKSEKFLSVANLFSVAGIALGVMSLIVILSVMNGVRSEMLKLITGFQGDVMVYSVYGKFEESSEIIPELKDLTDARVISRSIEGQVMVTSAHGSSAASVSGMDYANLLQKERIATSLKSGTLGNFKEGVVIGDAMARKLGVKTGGFITLISPQGRSTIMGNIPRIKQYEVIATFEVGMPLIDNHKIIMPMAKAQKFFKMDDAFNVIEIFLEDKND